MATTNLGKVSVTPKGEYDPLITYERLDIISHNGSSYIVKQASTGVTPIEGEFYALIAEKGDSGSFVKKAYKTYATMDADKVNIPANSSVDVTNDPDESKNGAYIYDGVAFTRSQYDSKVVTDKIIADTAIAVQDAITNTVISSGFVTIDSFELGATITQRNQALRHTEDGRLYRWAGDLPKVVPVGSTPTSSGGMGDNAWLEVSDVTLRQDLANPDKGAAMVGFKQEGSSTALNQADINDESVDILRFIPKSEHDNIRKGISNFDCSSSINHGLAVESARGGGVITFSSGEYKVSTMITVPDNISIRGKGKCVVTVASDMSASTSVFLFSGSKDQYISDIEVNGNGLSGYGINIDGADRFHVDNVYVHDTKDFGVVNGAGSALRIASSSNVRVTNSSFIDIGGCGVITLRAKYVVIDSCYAEKCKMHNYAFAEFGSSTSKSESCVLTNSVGIDSTWSGIDLETGTGCIVQGNTFINSGRYLSTATGILRSGIVCWGASYDNRITGNRIINPMWDGIVLVSPSVESRTVGEILYPVRHIVMGNAIQNPGRYGIFLNASQNQSFEKSAIIVSNNAISGSTDAGIMVGWATKGATIADNHIYDCGASGISIGSGDSLTITGNNIDTTVGSSIGTSARLMNSVVSNNILANAGSNYLHFYNGVATVENVAIVGNVVRNPLPEGIVFLRLYGTGGYKGVTVSANSVVGDLASAFSIFRSGVAVYEDNHITHGGRIYDLARNRWSYIDRTNPRTSISGTPSYIGELAVVAGAAYIATGVEAAEDWKKITEPPPESSPE